MYGPFLTDSKPVFDGETWRMITGLVGIQLLETHPPI